MYHENAYAYRIFLKDALFFYTLTSEKLHTQIQLLNRTSEECTSTRI